MKKSLQHIGWNNLLLLLSAKEWCDGISQKKQKQGRNSIEWWVFIHAYKYRLASLIASFKTGKHQFEPMKKHYFPDEVVLLWKYLDRLMIRLLFVVLRKTFRHIIPETCISTGGPSAIKPLARQLKRVIESGKYNYFIRFDIKGYYSSIDRAILFKQLQSHYDDPLTLKYLEAIVFNAIDDNGIVTVPEKGIPTRSSLSPFFGALYLSPLDLAFGSMDVFYRRFMDDGIFLLKNKHQYAKAKRRLFSVLRSLKLEVSPRKTKMGKLSSLHLLGVHFEVSRNLQGKTQVTAKLHSRSCSRALDNVVAMRKSAMPMADVRRYLVRWSTWWRSAGNWASLSLLCQWVVFAKPYVSEHSELSGLDDVQLFLRHRDAIPSSVAW